jgi:acylphosphatase
MNRRAELIIHGRVQKAGYRDFIDETAFYLNLTGYVKNLDDGTVQVICEGSEENLKEFIETININRYPIRVEKIDVSYKNPTGEFKTFEIIREEDLTTATFERMDMAARYMREMNAELSQRIDTLGDRLESRIDTLGDKIDKLEERVDERGAEISGEIRSLHDDFRYHFNERLSRIESELAEIRAKIAALQ